MLLVAVQLGHVERQGEHRPELGRRRVVVERGLEGLVADGHFHILSLRFVARLLAMDGGLGGGLPGARRIAARKPDEGAGYKLNDASCAAHDERRPSSSLLNLIRRRIGPAGKKRSSEV